MNECTGVAGQPFPEFYITDRYSVTMDVSMMNELLRMRCFVLLLLFTMQPFAASAQSDIDDILKQHHAAVSRAEQERLVAITKRLTKNLSYWHLFNRTG